MRHLNSGTLRRMVDEPISTTGAEKDHYGSCPACRERAMAIATEAERAAMLLALPDPEFETQAALSRLQRSAFGQKAHRRTAWTSLRNLFANGSSRTARPLAALALAMAAMVGFEPIREFTPMRVMVFPAIAPDLLDTFPDSESVNDALRSLKKIATRSAKPAQRQCKTASAAR